MARKMRLRRARLQGPPDDAYPSAVLNGVTRRWLILGAGGAGKSRLAREMAELLGLPVIHLDRHFWNPGWVETDRKGSRPKVLRKIAAEQHVRLYHLKSRSAARQFMNELRDAAVR